MCSYTSVLNYNGLDLLAFVIYIIVTVMLQDVENNVMSLPGELHVKLNLNIEFLKVSKCEMPSLKTDMHTIILLTD